MTSGITDAQRLEDIRYWSKRALVKLDASIRWQECYGYDVQFLLRLLDSPAASQAAPEMPPEIAEFTERWLEYAAQCERTGMNDNEAKGIAWLAKDRQRLLDRVAELERIICLAAHEPDLENAITIIEHWCPNDMVGFPDHMAEMQNRIAELEREKQNSIPKDATLYDLLNDLDEKAGAYHATGSKEDMDAYHRARAAIHAHVDDRTQQLRWALAEAEALNMNHEGHIAKLDDEIGGLLHDRNTFRSQWLEVAEELRSLQASTAQDKQALSEARLQILNQGSELAYLRGKVQGFEEGLSSRSVEGA